MELLRTQDDAANDASQINEVLCASLGRPLRIAHVGNIANNAFLSARLMREIGIEADVYSLGYLHVMGFPEWEELSFARSADESHFSGQFPEVTYRRPEWFHNEGMEQEVPSRATSLTRTNSVDWAMQRLERRRDLAKRVLSHLPSFVEQWVKDEVIPRTAPRRWSRFGEVLQSYDVVHLYGPSAALASWLRLPHVVATEHGTIRTQVWRSNYLSRTIRTGYASADAIIVTNQDSLAQARRLTQDRQLLLTSPHPARFDDLPSLRNDRLGALGDLPLRVLVPARQKLPSPNESGKGNSYVFEAIRALKNSGSSLRFVVPLWGDDIEASLDTVHRLGIEDRIDWSPLLSRPKLKAEMASSLAVIDQFIDPAYGAVSSDALAIGTPVLTAHLCSADVEAWGSCAPVRKVSGAEDLVRELQILERDYPRILKEHARRSWKWYDESLSGRIALIRSLRAYAFCLGAPI